MSQSQRKHSYRDTSNLKMSAFYYLHTPMFYLQWICTRPIEWDSFGPQEKLFIKSALKNLDYAPKNNTETCEIILIDNTINRYFIESLESMQVIDLSVMLIAYLR